MNTQFPNEIFGFNFTEYLTIFLALIFALAVGEFFISLGNLIRHRSRVKLYWEFNLWLFVILDFFIISWFSGWPRLLYLKFSLLNYFVIIFPYLIIYVIVAIYFPENSGHEKIDTKAHFMANRKVFFILWALYIFVNLLMDIFMPTQFKSYAVLMESIYTILLLAAAFFDKVWFRTLIVIILLSDMIGALIYL